MYSNYNHYSFNPRLLNDLLNGLNALEENLTPLTIDESNPALDNLQSPSNAPIGQLSSDHLNDSSTSELFLQLQPFEPLTSLF